MVQFSQFYLVNPMCKLFLRSSGVWSGAGGRLQPPTGTTPHEAGAAGARFQETHLHMTFVSFSWGAGAAAPAGGWGVPNLLPSSGRRRRHSEKKFAHGVS